MQTIQWSSWAPYLNNPGILMGFIALLIAFVALQVFAKSRTRGSLGRNVIAAFFLVAAFIVGVAAYNSLRAPSNQPVAAARPTEKSSTADPAVNNADTRMGQFTNIQIVNGSHNSVQNHAGKSQ